MRYKNKQNSHGPHRDDGLSLQELEQVDSFFTVLFIALKIGVCAIAVYAGFKGWTWWMAIPLAGLATVILRVLSSMLGRAVDSERTRLRALANCQEREMQLSSNQDQFISKVSLDEFTNLESAPGDIEKEIKVAKLNTTKREMTLTTIIIAAVFIGIFFGVFWYGLGLLINHAVS